MRSGLWQYVQLEFAQGSPAPVELQVGNPAQFIRSLGSHVQKVDG
jgi:hypothetical protein